MIIWSGSTATKYKPSHISLEWHAVFDEPYATTVGELCAGTTSIPRTNVTSICYRTQSKKDTS